MAATINALPPVPLLTDTPEIFDPKAVTFNLALNPFREQANTLAAEAEADAAAAEGSAQNSAQFAVNSANSAQEAQQFANGDIAEGSAKNWATRTTEIVDGLKGARGYAQDAAGSASSAATDATRAESAVATLPEGAIADAIIAPDKAWSSQKINSLMTLDDQLSFKSDFVRDEYFVDAGSRTFAPAEYVWDVVRPSPDYALSANGKYRLVPPNTISRAWNPETGQYEAQISGAVTNELLNNKYANATASVAPDSWVYQFQGGTRTVTASDYLASANSISHSGADVRDALQAPYSLPVDTDFTLSVHFEEGTSADGVVLNLFSLDGALPTSTAVFGADVTTPGRYSVSFRTSGTAGTVFVRIGLGCTGTATGTVVHSLPQLVQGTTPGPVIVTEDSPVTRAADEISRELGAEFNGSEGTIIVAFELASSYPLTEAPNIFSDTVSLNYRAEIAPDSGRLNFDVRKASGEFINTALPAIFGQKNIMALSWTATTFVASLNGEAYETATSFSFGAFLAGVYLGSRRGSSNYLNAGILRFEVTPDALAATQLQELTQ